MFQSNHKIFIVTVVSLFFLAITLGCSSPEGNIKKGKDWYGMYSCDGCHGENGNDGRGPVISGLTMGQFRFVRRLRTTETAVMPEYPESEISDQDAADILAYLKSL